MIVLSSCPLECLGLLPSFLGVGRGLEIGGGLFKSIMAPPAHYIVSSKAYSSASSSTLCPSPKEPPSGTLPSCVWFFILPVWQLVCKQYMAVLHRVAKPYVNGVLQGPAPHHQSACRRTSHHHLVSEVYVSSLGVWLKRLFLSLFDHCLSGPLGRPGGQMSYTCVFVHLCLSFWKG